MAIEGLYGSSCNVWPFHRSKKTAGDSGMKHQVRSALVGTTVVVALVGSGGFGAHATTFPTSDQAITHVLNRLGYGPRPGDVEKVRAVGLERYIEQQLQPDRLPDLGMAARLSRLTTLNLGAEAIASEYELPELEARRERRAAAKDADPGADQQPKSPNPLQQKANRLVVELSEQKILRAVYSERQLQEVLVDFWFNHFNVDARKGRVRFMLTEYDRDAIRPHVLGRFRDVLGATAKSPAMLFYLDNWMSASAPRLGTGQSGPPGTGQSAPDLNLAPGGPQRTPRRGLNENYGRELLELHTLGVDGGYTQLDVTEVARAFTGWTIAPPRQGGGFRFDPRMHDTGEKLVLGQVIKAGGGESDGERVLDILARHPATARFIATKLVRRFVSDTPPPALVARVAERFRETDGDLREVMRTLLTSPAFLAPDAYGVKTKTPFEFVVSALRTTDAIVDDAMPLVRTLQQLGMPPYLCQPPTGYRDTADAWVNTGGLVARMNVAIRLAHNDQERALGLGSPQFQRR
jgi:uncharacterized protein (DUF1800 family)